MKVTSPVGDFPFEPRALRFDGTSVVLEGDMGAWPATVTIDVHDLPRLVRLVPKPVLLALALGGVVVLMGLRR